MGSQGLNQGLLWIKVIEAVGLELEENPAAGTNLSNLISISILRHILK